MLNLIAEIFWKLRNFASISDCTFVNVWVLKAYWSGEGKGILQLKNAVFKDDKKKIKNAIQKITKLLMCLSFPSGSTLLSDTQSLWITMV